MDYQIGIDLLTNPKKIKKKKTENNSNITTIVSETYSPHFLDSIINSSVVNLCELIKYRYQIKKDNEKLANDILNDILENTLNSQLLDFSKTIIKK